MISVEEALAYIGGCAHRLPARRVALGEALGLHLAEPIISAVDSPPFDKSMVDGYAISVHDPSPTHRILEQVLAGGVPHHAIQPGATISLMTGAPVPEGADAVVKQEDVQQLDESRIQLPASEVAEGDNILHQGAAFQTGQEVLAADQRLGPIEIALLAELGQATVLATPRPRVAVLPTGNELVDGDQPLAAGQIHNSNGPLLLAALESLRMPSVDLGIGRDEQDELRRLMQQGLEADVLVVTGGVSTGVKDLAPSVLAELGVRQVFHKVRMKPGKPLWFGVYEQDERQTLVFGLPGNPVSTLVSMEIFVKPALRALAGEPWAPASTIRSVLTDAFAHRGNRLTYHPCHLHFGQRAQGLPCVEPLVWRGSADLAALTRANALAVLPEGAYQLEAGSEVDVVALRAGSAGDP